VVAQSITELLAIVEQIERCVLTVNRLVKGVDNPATHELSARLQRLNAALPRLKTHVSGVTNEINARVMQDAASSESDRRTAERRHDADRRTRRESD
jgi:hypothetical protein